jgi:DNA repair photolyase
MSDYWDYRAEAARILPRMTVLDHQKGHVNAVREKGRKGGYQEFRLDQDSWVKQERLLNTEVINSFVEVSCRAAACPMPLNIDTWDGKLCPFGCIYCYANAFRASLYTAFFDNSKTMGFRHCNPDHYRRELDKLMPLRGKDPHSISGDVRKSIAMEIPMRFGIRFEDFLEDERELGVSLNLLNYLADQDYPVMINTKSDLVGREDYLEVLARNGAGSAVHVTLISSDTELLRTIEPGAPSVRARLKACRKMADAGIRVVARIEPFLLFINDVREQVEEYMELVWDTGVRNITFDTYSYTAHNPGIRRSFIRERLDFERLFLLGCDSQGIGSFLLGKFMDEFRKKGFSCSTFDMGNAPSNDQDVCCEVSDWFQGGYNYGCSVMAARFITRRGRMGLTSSWSDFEEWVNKRGGFLSEALRQDVWRLWNTEGQEAYSHSWGSGIEPAGRDRNGIIWKFDEAYDFREEMFEGVLDGKG